jgi:hypothetical protein
VTQLPDPRGPTYRLPEPPPPDPTGWYELRRKARATFWPPRDIAWAALLAGAVSAAGLYGLWFQATLPGRLPSTTDWKAVAAVLARDAQPGDAVALAPPWAERAREVLPERLPSRPEVPLPVLAHPSYAEGVEDLPGISRVWLLSLPDAPGGAGSIASQLAARSSLVEGPVRIGRLTLTRNDLREPLLPLWSLADRVHSALIQGSAPAAREVREVGSLPRRCVLARLPGPGAEPVVLRLSAVPLGVALRGHVGLVGDPSGGAPPVSLRVKVDGVELGRTEASAAPPAWKRFTVDTSRLPPIPHEVTVEIVPSGPLPLGVCVDLVALP